MSTRSCVLAAAAILSLAAAGSAQELVVSCEAQRTIRDCRERHVPIGGIPRQPGENAALAADAEERLRAMPTGTDLSADGPLSAFRDFLPRLAGALLTPATGEGAQSLGFKTNFALNDGKLFDWGVAAQLAAVVHEAEPFAQLVDSIPAAGRDVSVERIRAGLEPYDDITFSGALNLENRTFGRGMRPHQDMIDSFLNTVLDSVGMTVDDDINQQTLAIWMRFGQRVRDGGGLDPARAGAPECSGAAAGDVMEVRVDCLTKAFQDSVEQAILGEAAARTRSLSVGERQLRQAGVLRLAQLINNQPQLNGSVEYRARNDVVGPQEWKGTVRFEMGFANMNGLRRECAGPVRADCLHGYVEDDNVRRSLARGDRVWAQAELTRRNAWDVSLPDDAVSLALGTATTWAVSGGYGAYFGNQEDGENRDRLDLQGKYDFTGDDALRQNRFVATLFYTRRLSDQSSALLGVSYANRPEFLGDVTRNVSANLGLTYKLNKGAATP